MEYWYEEMVYKCLVCGQDILYDQPALYSDEYGWGVHIECIEGGY